MTGYSAHNKNVKFCWYWNIHIKSNHMIDNRELVFDKKRLNIKGQPFLRVSGERWIFFMWVGMGGWKYNYILGGWGWLDILWGWVEVYFMWVGMGGHYLWVGGGRWSYILGDWGLVNIFYGWVGVGGGIFLA